MYYCYPHLPPTSCCFCEMLRAFKDRHLKINIMIIIIIIKIVKTEESRNHNKSTRSVYFRLCLHLCVSETVNDWIPVVLLEFSIFKTAG